MPEALDRELDHVRSHWKRSWLEHLVGWLGAFAAISIAWAGVWSALRSETEPPAQAATPAVPVAVPVARPPNAVDERFLEVAGNLEGAPRGGYVIARRNEPRLRRLLALRSARDPKRRAEANALLASLRSYFGIEITVADFGAIDSGMLEQAQGFFVLGAEPLPADALNASLREQLLGSDKPIAWLGYGIQLAALEFGLEYDGHELSDPVSGAGGLHYRGVDMELPPSAIALVDFAELAGGVEILATLSSPSSGLRPAITARGNRLYVAFWPTAELEGSLALSASVDAISLLLGAHQPDPRLLLRLEDIDAGSYPTGSTSFQKTAAVATELDIPLLLGIVPLTVNEQGERVASIWDSEPVIGFVRDHPDAVTIVQHGTLHHRLDPRNAGLASTAAWEFFPDDDETLGREEAARFAWVRMQEGFLHLARGGLFPRIYEAPHYELSPSQERVAASIYPILHHPPLFWDGYESYLRTPWWIQRGGTIHAPEAFGFIARDDPESVSELCGHLETLARVMPDPIGIVMFHPFMIEVEGRERDLHHLVGCARSLGYRFVSTFDELAPGGPTGNGHDCGQRDLQLDGSASRGRLAQHLPLRVVRIVVHLLGLPNRASHLPLCELREQLRPSPAHPLRGGGRAGPRTRARASRFRDLRPCFSGIGCDRGDDSPTPAHRLSAQPFPHQHRQLRG